MTAVIVAYVHPLRGAGSVTDEGRKEIGTMRKVAMQTGIVSVGVCVNERGLSPSRGQSADARSSVVLRR